MTSSRGRFPLLEVLVFFFLFLTGCTLLFQQHKRKITFFMLNSEQICFQNSTITSSQCSKCFYGPFCHFTTSYYDITSLEIFRCAIDNIGYGIIFIIFIIGSLLNFLSIVTFCQTDAREMGNGIYRLWISIIGQIGITIIGIHIILGKYHYNVISCFILEYIRNVIHAVYDSLTACTTFERTMVVYYGASFNKNLSRKSAKLIVMLLILYHFISMFHQSFYRRIIYSFDRYWCVFIFTNHSLFKYQSTINILNITVPYVINLIFPVIGISILTKTKSTLNKNTSIWSNIKHIVMTYKYTLIGGYTLVLLNTPRIIATLFLTCIKENWQNTSYITAYFVSMIPFTTNLFMFVLPSPKYRTELYNFVHKIMKYRSRCQYNVT